MKRIIILLLAVFIFPLNSSAERNNWQYSMYGFGEGAMSTGGTSSGKIILDGSGAKVKYGVLGLGAEAVYKKRFFFRTMAGYGNAGDVSANYDFGGDLGTVNAAGDVEADIVAAEFEWMLYPKRRITPFVNIGMHRMNFDANLTEVSWTEGDVKSGSVKIDSTLESYRYFAGLRWVMSDRMLLDVYYGQWDWDLDFVADGKGDVETEGLLLEDVEQNISSSGSNTDNLYGISSWFKISSRWYLKLNYERREMTAETRVDYDYINGVIGYRF